MKILITVLSIVLLLVASGLIEVTRDGAFIRTSVHNTRG